MQKVTYAKFTEFLNEVVPDAKCEMCGCPEWIVDKKGKYADFLHEGKLLVDIPSSKGAEFKFYPGILVYCQNCGNSKFFVGKVFENWLKGNKSKATAQSELKSAGGIFADKSAKPETQASSPNSAAPQLNEQSQQAQGDRNE